MNSMQNIENPALYAEALKGMGRGPDTQLMHVTDSEVDALNGLSGLVFNEPLRTNPETGLPEAGLFKQLLPTILAIGAATFMGPAAGAFLGPAAAGGLGLSTGLATGLGTGLAAFGGHLAGQGLSGQELNLGSAALAGAGSGLMAGFGAAGDAGAASATNPGGMGAGGEGALSSGSAMNFDPNLEVAGWQGGMAPKNVLFDMAVPGSPTFAPDLNAYGSTEAFSLPTEVADIGLPVTSTASTPASEMFASSVRSPTEAYNYLAAEPGKRLALPLGIAALSGELDEPLPEAPAGPSRTPFTPKDFKFTRQRRDIDIDGDGEISEEEISEVVQGLPEGQSSRFFTPGVFTEDELNAKEGGLLRLQTGGNIQEAIGALTGGAGASLLPILAQSVIRPEDEEEEESVTKGYPLGVAGTAPGAASTGMAIGGGQPPQPFQEGGLTALEEAFKDSGGGNAGIGEGPGPSGAPAGAGSAGAGSTGAGSADNSTGMDTATGAGLVGTAVGAITGMPGLGLAANALAQTASYLSQPEQGRHTLSFQPLSVIGLGKTIGEQAAEEAANAQSTAVNATTAAMIDEDEPESIDVPGSLGLGGGEAGASGVGSGAGAPGGPQGEGDTIGGEEGSDGGPDGGPDGDGSGGSGPGDGGADGADGGAAVKQGGYLGGISSRAHGGLLQLAEGGSVPYFEGMVRGPGDGMSDNIPFVIAGRQEGGQMGMQPAVLSPDEYVFPADVVSSLGNGSSNAGANQLDQFINNFRMDKYGRPSQPPEMSGGLSSLG